MSSKVSLNINKISVAYNTTPIIENLSYSFCEGNTYCITGNNGSGKSTLLKAIIGENTLLTGTIELYNIDITKIASFERRHLGISFLSQHDSCFKSLKVSDHFELVSNKMRNWQDVLKHYLPEVIELSNDYGGNLSGGQQRLLGFALILIQENKRVILLDEVFSGVSNKIQNTIKKIITNVFQNKERTIILVEQNEEIINYFNGNSIDIELLKNK